VMGEGVGVRSNFGWPLDSAPFHGWISSGQMIAIKMMAMAMRTIMTDDFHCKEKC
jgi:formylmethanofuran dehydrogenase subunit E